MQTQTICKIFMSNQKNITLAVCHRDEYDKTCAKYVKLEICKSLLLARNM
jgi:hypothetical protein